MKVATFLAALLFLFSSPVLAEETTEEFFQPYAAVIPTQSIEDAENYARRALQPQDLALFRVSSDDDVFLIWPIVDGLHAQLFELSVDEEGRLIRSASPIMQTHLGDAQKYKALVLCIPVSEGAPSLELCLESDDGEGHCWQPRYSGETGELVMDRGFLLWSRSES